MDHTTSPTRRTSKDTALVQDHPRPFSPLSDTNQTHQPSWLDHDRATVNSYSHYSQSSIAPSMPVAPKSPTSPIPEHQAYHDPYMDDDEEAGSYGAKKTANEPLESQHAPLVENAAGMGMTSRYQDMDYADPPDTQQKGMAEKAGPFARFIDNAKYPLQQRIEDKKRGIGRQRYPFAVWTLTAVMIAVFIYELVVNSKAQGTPVSFKPVVNPMLGPSSSALINVGARFPPCMKLVEQVPPSTRFGCLSNTANPPDQICSLETICGFGGFHGKDPNQWFRFITPIFLHAGFIHILINMLAQITLSAQIEREMGSTGFLITYFAAGIFGNILGGNFSLVGVPSVGASGAIFGTVAVTWVDLFAHWKYQYRPGRKLAFMTVELLIGVAIGFIPFVDNFAHLGGFLLGLLVGTTFYPVISETKRHRLIVWTFRIIAIPLAVILFVVLTRNFYTSDPYAACSGCRYLSCIPIAANNYCKGTGLTTSST